MGINSTSGGSGDVKLQQSILEQTSREIRRVADADGDGQITESELANLTDEQIAAIKQFVETAANADGVVDTDEHALINAFDTSVGNSEDAVRENLSVLSRSYDSDANVFNFSGLKLNYQTPAFLSSLTSFLSFGLWNRTPVSIQRNVSIVGNNENPFSHRVDLAKEALIGNPGDEGSMGVIDDLRAANVPPNEQLTAMIDKLEQYRADPNNKELFGEIRRMHIDRGALTPQQYDAVAQLDRAVDEVFDSSWVEESYAYDIEHEYYSLPSSSEDMQGFYGWEIDQAQESIRGLKAEAPAVLAQLQELKATHPEYADVDLTRLESLMGQLQESPLTAEQNRLIRDIEMEVQRLAEQPSDNPIGSSKEFKDFSAHVRSATSDISWAVDDVALLGAEMDYLADNIENTLNSPDFPYNPEVRLSLETQLAAVKKAHQLLLSGQMPIGPSDPPNPEQTPPPNMTAEEIQSLNQALNAMNTTYIQQDPANKPSLETRLIRGTQVAQYEGQGDHYLGELEQMLRPENKADLLEKIAASDLPPATKAQLTAIVSADNFTGEVQTMLDDAMSEDPQRRAEMEAAIYSTHQLLSTLQEGGDTFASNVPVYSNKDINGMVNQLGVQFQNRNVGETLNRIDNIFENEDAQIAAREDFRSRMDADISAIYNSGDISDESMQVANNLQAAYQTISASLEEPSAKDHSMEDMLAQEGLDDKTRQYLQDAIALRDNMLNDRANRTQELVRKISTLPPESMPPELQTQLLSIINNPSYFKNVEAMLNDPNIDPANAEYLRQSLNATEQLLTTIAETPDADLESALMGLMEQPFYQDDNVYELALDLNLLQRSYMLPGEAAIQDSTSDKPPMSGAERVNAIFTEAGAVEAEYGPGLSRTELLQKVGERLGDDPPDYLAQMYSPDAINNKLEQIQVLDTHIQQAVESLGSNSALLEGHTIEELIANPVLLQQTIDRLATQERSLSQSPSVSAPATQSDRSSTAARQTQSTELEQVQELKQQLTTLQAALAIRNQYNSEVVASIDTQIDALQDLKKEGTTQEYRDFVDYNIAGLESARSLLNNPLATDQQYQDAAYQIVMGMYVSELSRLPDGQARIEALRQAVANGDISNAAQLNAHIQTQTPEICERLQPRIDALRENLNDTRKQSVSLRGMVEAGIDGAPGGVVGGLSLPNGTDGEEQPGNSTPNEPNTGTPGVSGIPSGTSGAPGVSGIPPSTSGAPGSGGGFDAFGGRVSDGLQERTGNMLQGLASNDHAFEEAQRFAETMDQVMNQGFSDILRQWGENNDFVADNFDDLMNQALDDAAASSDLSAMSSIDAETQEMIDEADRMSQTFELDAGAWSDVGELFEEFSTVLRILAAENAKDQIAEAIRSGFQNRLDRMNFERLLDQLEYHLGKIENMDTQTRQLLEDAGIDGNRLRALTQDGREYLEIGRQMIEPQAIHS